jgi:competence protein ComGC
MLAEHQDMKTRNWETVKARSIEPFSRPTLTSLNRHITSNGKTCMSARATPRNAFTLVELLIIVVALSVLAALLIPALRRAKNRAERITCTNHLMQIGTAFKIWGTDRKGLYPMSISTTNGGSLEYVGAADVFRHFQVMSDELGASTLALVCPADSRQSAQNFGPGFSNAHISYFLGIGAREDRPDMLLAGDRNITNGMPLKNGILELTTNSNAGWTHELHKGQGNVLLSDASVQAWDTPSLRKGIQNSGVGTNRLAMP